MHPQYRLSSLHPEYAWFFCRGGLLGTRYPQIPKAYYTVFHSVICIWGINFFFYQNGKLTSKSDLGWSSGSVSG
jgi:hypothetical protein